MNYLNINQRRSHASILGFCFAALIMAAGCVEVRNVDIHPTVLPPAAADKSPMSAALVIDKPLKDYGIMVQLVGGTAKYPLGQSLERYAQDVSRDIFKLVTVYDSIEAATNKADVILVPKAVRSSAFITNPIKVLVCVEWSVKDGVGQKMLWLTTVDSEATETPGAFSHKKSMQIAFQRAIDDLCFKTLKAFKESPEISRGLK